MAEKEQYKRPAPHRFHMRQKRGGWAATLLLSGAAVLAVILLFRMAEYRQAREEYAALAAMRVPEPMPMATPAVSAPFKAAATEAPSKSVLKRFPNAQIAALKGQNSDAVGFIDIAGTDMRYPIVQGTDNAYYETHSFSKKRLASGAIFMDAWNAEDFSDFNTVIYGHHMKDGSMFSGLREYRHDGFMRSHKYISIVTEYDERQYKVFAAYECGADMDFRGFAVAGAEEKQAFINKLVRASVITTNAEACADDLILTLATCTGGVQDRYWIVHAVLLTGEKEEIDSVDGL